MPQATPRRGKQKPPPQDPFATDDGQEEALPQVLKRLEIITKRRVENMFAGAYQSIFQGQGMVFADVRPYQPGDEVRWIDWNVSARMNDLYIKQFTEERERTVMLLWDASPSMDLGHRHRSKRELCAEVAMLLAMSAIHNGDRVGLILFADKVERYIAPQRGRKHVMRMIREILQCKPSPHETHNTAMTDALQFLNRVAPRHTITFVMSDFLAPFEEGLWQLLARKFDILPMILTDPLERTLPSPLHKPEKAPPEATETHPQQTSETPLAPDPKPGTSFIDNPWLTMVFGTLCVVFGFWMGGLWQWTGLATWFVCAAVAWTLRSPHNGAIYQLQDMESHNTITIDLTHDHTRTTLEQHAQEKRTSLEQSFKKMKIDPVYLPTEEEYISILLRYFRQRQRRSK